MSSIETIVIMAHALAKANLSDISKLDIIYTLKSDAYIGTLILANGNRYHIYDTGAVGILEGK